MLNGSFVTKAWKRRPPDMGDKCKYTEYAVANSRQGVVLLPKGVGKELKLTVKKSHITK